MIRTIYWFLFFFSYLIYSLPTLNKVRKLELPAAERDEIVFETPRKWSQKLVRLTGSRVTVKGVEHLPEGPVLFVSNHQGNFDIPVLLGFVPKPMGFISKMEVKKIPLVPKWMEAMNCVFINRKDRRQALQGIKDGIKILEDGHSLVIFPEGTRSKGGPVGPFKTGGLRLGIDSGVPIVPISINGTYQIMEHGGRFFKPAAVEVVISPPVILAEKPDSHILAEQLRDIISKNIA